MKGIKRRPKRRTPKSLTAVAEPLCVCPCGQPVHVTQDHTGLIHKLPMCDLFARLEVTEFLAHVRREVLGISDEQADAMDAAAEAAREDVN